MLKERENNQKKKLANLETKLHSSEIAYNTIETKKEILNESLRCHRCKKCCELQTCEICLNTICNECIVAAASSKTICKYCDNFN